ncbi:hypothetical protein NEMIN01_1609 [Nematocida minor]|uniref:uncharacterized protein n=1 Tax=Nematocida minor TaxID=1912983 RepID=UPI0022205AA1|nr:uncharacterized protein NEMIN01_1609 [Nematocida minor]KAI5191625.1 hypothetical protein NEMIN01_1609 [Nematocida minor]
MSWLRETWDRSVNHVYATKDALLKSKETKEPVTLETTVEETADENTNNEDTTFSGKIKNIFNSYWSKCILKALGIVSVKVLGVVDDSVTSIEGHFETNISSMFKMYVALFIGFLLIFFSSSIYVMSIIFLCNALSGYIELSGINNGWLSAGLLIFNFTLYGIMTALFYIGLMLYFTTLVNIYYNDLHKGDNLTRDQKIYNVLCMFSSVMVVSFNLMLIRYRTTLLYFFNMTKMGVFANVFVYFVFFYSNVLIIKYLYSIARQYMRQKVGKQYTPNYAISLYSTIAILIFSVTMTMLTGNAINMLFYTKAIAAKMILM